MVEFGKSSRKGNSAPFNQGHVPNAEKAFDTLLDIAITKFPSTRFPESLKALDAERNNLKETYRKFIDNVAKVPLITSFLLWIKEIGYLRSDTLLAAKELIENDFIGEYDNYDQFLTIGKAQSLDHHRILDAIRSKREWPIRRREILVQAYLEFMFWLSVETFGYIDPLEDPDWQRTKKRKLIYPQFIEFLDAIPSEKTQLIAKLLYFSENRPLESILGLEISNILFNAQQIDFSDFDLESYPEHIFNDIKSLIGDRTEGLIFLGRQEAPLNDATVFRHFNEAAKKVGLGDSFGPKKLVANIGDLVD